MDRLEMNLLLPQWDLLDEPLQTHKKPSHAQATESAETTS